MNALVELRNLPETRDEQHRFAAIAIEEIMNGDHDLVKMWVKLSIMADTLNEIKESAVFKNAAIREALKTTDKINGCEVKVVDRKTYDFSETNSDWVRLNISLEKLKKEIKEREAFLKALKSPVADPETGEIINPPTFTTTSYIQVK